MDEMGFDPSVLARLRATLPQTDVKPAYAVFREIQAVKSPEEQEILRVASRCAAEAIGVTLGIAREGISQRELVETYRVYATRQGAQPTHSYLRCGPFSAFSEVLPCAYTLKKGDLLSWDVGCIYQGYHADLAGTAVVGNPSERQIRYYRAVLAGERAAIAAIQPGVRVADVFHVAVATVRENGIPNYQRNHCGHGIGTEGYGIPLVAPDSSLCFEPGMVVNIETPYYEIGFGGVAVEDTILVTDTGHEYVSNISSDLRVI